MMTVMAVTDKLFKCIIWPWGYRIAQKETLVENHNTESKIISGDSDELPEDEEEDVGKNC
ncbi:hypothetical protein NECAME_12280 [Necator americanus]|uniref:Uncharacterized protein n=1 Tax=Necator americanus TaxID=51031 RepID=W2T1Y2_NECAM|nr:hypothetical protein NECAME_12280 [Necator americanus]ETN75579.1 hypothetical protein NECAME_12280 [Necator americanus]